MPARCGSKTDGSRLRRAAALFLDEDLSVPALRERFGLSGTSIHKAVQRLREERAEAKP
jgi:biotin operon repressor